MDPILVITVRALDLAITFVNIGVSRVLTEYENEAYESSCRMVATHLKMMRLLYEVQIKAMEENNEKTQ